MKRAISLAESPAEHYSIVKSPMGDLMLLADASGLTGLYFDGGNHLQSSSRDWKEDPKHPLLQQAAEQLEEFFAGRREQFSVPLHLRGTDFQKKVWEQIARIPHGQTLSYSELARRAGVPGAIRAAGTTTGRNPVAIIIPCHRVMGKDGSLCGFAGGLERKKFLLDLEQRGKKSSQEPELFSAAEWSASRPPSPALRKAL